MTVAQTPRDADTPRPGALWGLPGPELRVDFAGLTHVGKVRPNNEDQYFIARLTKSMEVLASSVPPEQRPRQAERSGYFLLVADGMGGAAGGEHASGVVVEEAQKHLMDTARWFFRLEDRDEELRLQCLREALERVDRRLIEEARANPALTGMGTTLTAASVVGADLFIVYVGDSRAYLFRGGRLDQLTHDQTLAQELVDRGALRPEDARTSRLRHVLTNAIGGRSGVQAAIVTARVQAGDRLLLCTDGLTDMVPDERVAELLRDHAAPQDACAALVEAALAGGGRDNVTVVVAALSA